MAEDETLLFCRGLPKIELHAHVNGSISDATLRTILERRGAHSTTGPDRGRHHVWGEMADCFAMFKTLHDVIDNPDDVRTVVRDVVRDFADDGVRYLELRSTPRAVEATGMTKYDHVLTICQAIEDCNEELDCITRLLLSIDRSHSSKSAKENVDLAIRFKPFGIVVGIDLGGNPTVNDGALFFHEILRAKNHGLKVAMHLCEVRGQDSETSKLLKLAPDRIGHGTFLHSESGGWLENEATVLEGKIPLELCLTSNLKTKTTPSYDDHHLTFWLDRGHPFVLGTDDKGIFRTTLSEEYAAAMKHLGLSREQIRRMILGSIEFIFEREAVKESLRADFAKIM